MTVVGFRTRKVVCGPGKTAGGRLLDVFFWLPFHFFLDFHVLVLVGVEDLAAIQTFDVLYVLFTRYDADFGVFAGDIHLGIF
jgi:hypothetical protein